MQLPPDVFFALPSANLLAGPWPPLDHRSFRILIDGAHAMLQVYDLQEYRPGAVLRKIWKNFEAQERNGDTWAPIVRGCALGHPAMPPQTACSLGERICCFDMKECPVTASSYLPKHNVQAHHQSVACARR